MITDAYTRTCQACANAYQSDDYEDPTQAGPWSQDIGPCCFHGPSFAITQAVHTAKPFQSIPPWAPHTATQKAEARWNLKMLRTQDHIIAP